MEETWLFCFGDEPGNDHCDVVLPIEQKYFTIGAA
jgi:hypothetical protein